ncbi:MAG: DUF929 family protein [Acidimicrobiales bacterium]|jgi:hypothetical protein
MADNAQTPRTGGNKPKPTGSGGNESAKDKSRAASRPVAAKGPGKGGNAPRSGATKGAPAGGPKGSNRGPLIAWGAVALVVVIIAVLVIVKLTQSSPQNLSYTPVAPAPAQVVHDITTIPMSTWNKVGVTSQFPVEKPTVTTGQPAMVLNGKTPAMLYYGAEYCPYCAAERWAMAAALSRFGTWSNLQITASSHTDVDADTHTLSFHGASLDSPYITFVGIEQYTNIPTAAGAYTVLQNPTDAEGKILAKYSSSKFIPNGSTSGGISFPFVDINNGMLISGASYDPQILAGLTWTDISGGLSDPTNPVTQVILSTANYMTAGICQATKGKPGNVCTSSGVQAAAKSLGITIG